MTFIEMQNNFGFTKSMSKNKSVLLFRICCFQSFEKHIKYQSN